MYTVDNSRFKEIKTEEDAYWLGYIFADGCVREDSRALIIASVDLDQLEKFKKYMNYSGPIRKVKKSKGSYAVNQVYRIVVCSSKVCSYLNLLGKTPGKLVMPDLPDELSRHFIRGYFDGDGSISISDREYTVKGTHYKYQNVPYISLIIHQDNLDWFYSRFCSYFKFNYKKSKTNYMFYIVISGKKNCFAFKEYCYDNSTIYMNRKYNLFQNMAPLYSNIKLKTQNMLGPPESVSYQRVKIETIGQSAETAPLGEALNDYQ